ncbi:hypothetical protein CPB86DRAFT_803688 [Serendipita vermifera]|nr:hypothetical protein CPB86DRAFT_803688 [Serendipita vermifera]
MLENFDTNTPSTRQDALSSTLPPELATAFLLGQTDSSYKHQYANIYFVRLNALRKYILPRAEKQWKGMAGTPTLVPRVLDVRKGQLCWIVGTIYKEMPLKDNVLNDLAKEHGIAPPPPRLKFYSDNDQTILEDESGRIFLTGDVIPEANLVTGLVVAVLGAETAAGEFRVQDVCYPGAAPQASVQETKSRASMEIDNGNQWVAMVSGLNVGLPSSSADLKINLLVEYLLGEVGITEDQHHAATISRLIVAGDSFAPVDQDQEGVNDLVTVPGELADIPSKKAARKYGYDGSTFSVHPTLSLSGHLSELSRAMTVHLIPGASDPSSITLPQQPLPRAMFGNAKNYENFHVETNPCWIGIGTCHILGSGGQPLDDIFRYVRSSDRLQLACEMIKWRHMAPTAPDTLWCYPYFSSDPFIMAHTPHIYVIGNQPRFETRIVEQDDGPKTRVILLPKFSDCGEVVLVNPLTLAVKSIRIDCL